MKKRMRNIAAAAVLCVSLASFAVPAWAAGWTQEDGGLRWYNMQGQYSTDMWKKGSDGEEHWLGDDGYMVTDAWVQDDGKYYYVDADGNKLTETWKELEAPENEAGVVGRGPHWYYFGPTGKRLEERWQKENGKKYYLGVSGVMETGWILDNLYYTGEDGAAVTGWQRLIGPDNTEKLYWFNASGKKYVPEDGEAWGLKKIDGEKFIFDADGAIASGLCEVKKQDGSYAVYYCGEPGAEEICTGYQLIKNADGSAEEYRFSDTGEGVTGIANGKLYYSGRLQKADPEDRYRVITIEDGGSTKNILVDAAGHIRRSRTVTDRNGRSYETDSEGVVTAVDSTEVAEGTAFDKPDEPDIRS